MLSETHTLFFCFFFFLLLFCLVIGSLKFTLHSEYIWLSLQAIVNKVPKVP